MSLKPKNLPRQCVCGRPGLVLMDGLCGRGDCFRAEAERRITEWLRERARHYVHLNKLADWYNGAADAIERSEHRG